MDFESEIASMIKSRHLRKSGDEIDIRAVRMVIHSLQWVSSGYDAVLYFAGKRVGENIIASASKGDKLKAIKELFGNYKMGKVEIIKDGSREMTIRIRDSMTAGGMKPIGKRMCFFEAGLMAGIVEKKAGGHVTCNEVMCCGAGDDACEFVIKVG